MLTPLYTTTTSSSILPLVPFPFLLLHHRLCSSICLFYGRSFASQEGLKGVPRDAQIRVTGDPLEAACLPRTLHADTTRAVDLPLDTHTRRLLLSLYTQFFYTDPALSSQRAKGCSPVSPHIFLSGFSLLHCVL